MTSGLDGADGAESISPYNQYVRRDMVALVPPGSLRVLDLGCAAGRYGAAVKERTGSEVWGIEINEAVAKLATRVLDRVLVGDVNHLMPELPDGHFDVIACNDVLEHMVNPDEVLRRLRPKIAPGGVVIASIPNIRFAWALNEIVFKRDFPQEDAGVFDRTHLRFFTKKSILRLFENSGFAVKMIKGLNPHYRPIPLLFAVASLGWLADGIYPQFACVASPVETR